MTPLSRVDGMYRVLFLFNNFCLTDLHLHKIYEYLVFTVWYYALSSLLEYG